MGWTPKIEHKVFAVEYVLSGGSAVTAYRRTKAKFPNTFRGKPVNDRFHAHQLKKKPWMQGLIGKVEQVVMKKADITMDSLLTKLERSYNMAESMSKPSDMINAAMSQAKLVGLLKERIETGAPGAFDETENVADILKAVAEKQGEAAALVLAKQFGITLDITETATQEETAPEQLIVRKPPTDSVN